MVMMGAVPAPLEELLSYHLQLIAIAIVDMIESLSIVYIIESLSK
jgi:hypothetical protein